eukprot:TRINITY_DN10765_c0_g1_i1.p1 TRINITY_DN10765_c0_g1~~TRINITY_DN10765_c0_g1_i1.p1  ORF type:complete len:235 (-),score=80.19 TRINITY_DN10765_c0_g1_i1:34-738(-)
MESHFNHVFFVIQKVPNPHYQPYEASSPIPLSTTPKIPPPLRKNAFRNLLRSGGAGKGEKEELEKEKKGSEEVGRQGEEGEEEEMRKEEGEREEEMRKSQRSLSSKKGKTSKPILEKERESRAEGEESRSERGDQGGGCEKERKEGEGEVEVEEKLRIPFFYKVQVTCKDEVKPFPPFLSPDCFLAPSELREVLLTKMINAETSVCESAKTFLTMTNTVCQSELQRLKQLYDKK